MRLGRLLQLWRRREALTLRAAAAKIGINPSTLGRIERGESMHGATLTTVLVWLMGREEPSANEAFTFEAKDAVAVKEIGENRDMHEDCGENDVTLKSFHHVAERNTAPAAELERITYTFSGEETGPGESSSNTCQLGAGNETFEIPIVASPGITALPITADIDRTVVAGPVYPYPFVPTHVDPDTRNLASPGIPASVITVDGSRFEFKRREQPSPIHFFIVGNPPELHLDDVRRQFEGPEWQIEAPGATVEDEQEAAAEHPVHVVGQNAALCGVRQEQLGGGAHGEEGVGPEGAG